MEMDVDLHAADVDEPGPLGPGPGEARHRLGERIGMNFAPVDIHLVRAEFASMSRLGQADRIEHIERHAARGRGAGHLPLAGHLAGVTGAARSGQSRAERRRADRRDPAPEPQAGDPRRPPPPRFPFHGSSLSAG